jgi:type I restriction enzyme S subunit
MMDLIELGKEVELVTKGTTPMTLGKKFATEGIPFLRAQNIINGGVLLNEDLLFIDKDTHNKELKRSHIINGDILLTIAGTIGRTAIVRNIDRVLNCNQAVAIIRLGDSKIFPEYLCHYIASPIAQAQFKKGVVFATIPNLSLSQIKKLQIPLPPLPQQQKIAAILDAADALRQNDKALIAKYDELTQALFLDMFGDPVSNPRGWKKTTGRKVFKLIGGAAFKSTDYSNDGIPLIRIGAVNKGYFDKSQLVFLPLDFNSRYKKYLVYPNDLLITLTGTVGKDDYGNAFSLEKDFEKYFLNQRVAKITLDEFYNYTFIKFYLKQKRVKSELIGVSRGVRQANISNEDFYKLEVIQPSINIQNQFAERVALIEQQKAIAQMSLEKSEDLFNSLLHKAFKRELV